MAKRIGQRLICVVSLVATQSFVTVAHASDYPNRTIKIVVPYSTGGGTDLIFRVLGKGMSDVLKTPVIIENRPGAAGTLGANLVAKSSPDGYTLLAYTLALVTSRHAYKDLPFDASKDFTGIGQVAVTPNAVVVNSELPVNTFDELIQLAKQRPNELNYASSGVSGTDHLGGELLQYETSIALTHVPYKGGGESNMAAASGMVQVLAGTLATSAPFIKSGKLKPLMVMQPTYSTPKDFARFVSNESTKWDKVLDGKF